MVNDCDKRIARCVFGAQKLPLRGHLRWSGQGFAPGDDEPFLHPCTLGSEGVFNGSALALPPLGRGYVREHFGPERTDQPCAGWMPPPFAVDTIQGRLRSPLETPSTRLGDGSPSPPGPTPRDQGASLDAGR